MIPHILASLLLVMQMEAAPKAPQLVSPDSVEIARVLKRTRFSPSTAEMQGFYVIPSSFPKFVQITRDTSIAYFFELDDTSRHYLPFRLNASTLVRIPLATGNPQSQSLESLSPTPAYGPEVFSFHHIDSAIFLVPAHATDDFARALIAVQQKRSTRYLDFANDLAPFVDYEFYVKIGGDSIYSALQTAYQKRTSEDEARATQSDLFWLSGLILIAAYSYYRVRRSRATRDPQWDPSFKYGPEGLLLIFAGIMAFLGLAHLRLAIEERLLIRMFLENGEFLRMILFLAGHIVTLVLPFSISIAMLHVKPWALTLSQGALLLLPVAVFAREHAVTPIFTFQGSAPAIAYFVIAAISLFYLHFSERVRNTFQFVGKRHSATIQCPFCLSMLTLEEAERAAVAVPCPECHKVIGPNACAG